MPITHQLDFFDHHGQFTDLVIKTLRRLRGLCSTVCVLLCHLVDPGHRLADPVNTDGLLLGCHGNFIGQVADGMGGFNRTN
jgi:hypothetical protein